MIKAFFSDIDGTFLNADHRVLPSTIDMIEKYRDRLHFALVSARSPSGIYPILRRYGLSMAIISYSGAWIQDEDGMLLYEHGMEIETAKEVLAFIRREKMDLTPNVYSGDLWLVKERRDPRVQREERIVEANANEGGVEVLPKDAHVHKILCMCPSEKTKTYEQKLKDEFPNLMIVKSSDILIEIMEAGVDKAQAVDFLCTHWKIDPSEAIAFGDNYNDEGMLAAVGVGVTMGNAPKPLLEKAAYVTADYEHDGIARAMDRFMDMK